MINGEPEPGGPEALPPTQGMAMLGEEQGEEALPWLPEKMRLSELLRVSRGTSLQRRPPLRGEPKGGVTDGLEQHGELSWYLLPGEVTSMYLISWEDKQSTSKTGHSGCRLGKDSQEGVGHPTILYR